MNKNIKLSEADFSRLQHLLKDLKGIIRRIEDILTEESLKSYDKLF